MNTLVQTKANTPDDAAFIKEINKLIDMEGDKVCQAFFKLYATIELPPYTARKNWFDIIEQRRSMTLALGRDVALLTVMADYLTSTYNYFKNPKIIEFDTYEKALEDLRHDTLTGLLNRGCLWDILNGQLGQASRHNTELTLLFLDIDNFKQFNDSCGHQAGDQALAAIARVIGQETRSEDMAIRYGGEEFVVVMPNTGALNALVFAERIRDRVENLRININGHSHSFTISGGLASYPDDAEDDYMLLNMADRALYQSKAKGKNMISIFADEKQRAHPRCKLKRPVKIKKIGIDSTPPILGSSRDICMGGMLFETDQQIDVGANIEVSVPVINTEPLFLIGSVVRVKPAEKGRYAIGMAISFQEMERAARDEIATFVMKKQRGGKEKRRMVTSPAANIVEM